MSKLDENCAKWLFLRRSQLQNLIFLAQDVEKVVLKAGADNFLIKPVKSKELLQAIERSLARHRSAREMKRGLDVLRKSSTST
jgi:FixJ family two-component response regulator